MSLSTCLASVRCDGLTKMSQDQRRLQLARAYSGAVIGAGAGVLALRLPLVRLDEPFLFLVLLAGSFVISGLKVPLPIARGKATLSMSYFTDFLALGTSRCGPGNDHRRCQRRGAVLAQRARAAVNGSDVVQRRHAGHHDSNHGVGRQRPGWLPEQCTAGVEPDDDRRDRPLFCPEHLAGGDGSGSRQERAGGPHLVRPLSLDRARVLHRRRARGVVVGDRGSICVGAGACLRAVVRDLQSVPQSISGGSRNSSVTSRNSSVTSKRSPIFTSRASKRSRGQSMPVIRPSRTRGAAKTMFAGSRPGRLRSPRPRE